MADETASTDADQEKDENKPTLFDQPEGTDWFVAHLVNLANNFGIELPVTVFVSGTLVCGTLIGGRTYFREIADSVSKAGTGNKELVEALSTSLRQFDQVYPESEQPNTRPVGYVHLRKAQVFLPGQKAAPVEGMLWRGKASAVDGISLGTLTATQY